MFLSVLVAIDGWEFTTRLLDLVKRVSSDKTKVQILYVDGAFSGKLENIKYIDNMTDLKLTNSEQVIQDALCYLKITGGIEAEGTIMGGDTASVILDRAKEMNCELVIMGHRHLSKINRFFDPSITIKVVKKALCPVLVDSLS